jgi:transcriptional regulator with XRE-family HTH domain
MRSQEISMQTCTLPRRLLDLPEYRLIGAAIAAARVTAGVTQQQLAARIARPLASVSAIERGEQPIDVLEAYYILKALGVPPLRGFETICGRLAHAGAGSPLRPGHL